MSTHCSKRICQLHKLPSEKHRRLPGSQLASCSDTELSTGDISSQLIFRSLVNAPLANASLITNFLVATFLVAFEPADFRVLGVTRRRLEGPERRATPVGHAVFVANLVLVC